MRRQQTMFQQAQTYLEYRRALGFEMRGRDKLLLDFAKFVDGVGQAGPLTTDLTMQWVHLPKNAASTYKGNRLSIVRGFAQYLAARDGLTEVPDWRIMPKGVRRRPHIFSERQLEQLLAATERIIRTYPLRPLAYQTLFGLLASTGLRISEALKFARGQVDLKDGVLRIERTKFKKSRLVLLHPTTTQALRRYATARDRQWGQNADQPFFVGRRGLALPYRTVGAAFRTICDDLGWYRGNGEWPRPRIHDLRHTFACHCLLRWHRAGENVHYQIAALSTYMGHRRITDTYWYLTGTPELLAVAGSKFERLATKVERGLA